MRTIPSGATIATLTVVVMLVATVPQPSRSQSRHSVRPDRCPIAALRLMVVTSGQPPVAMATLTPDGSFSVVGVPGRSSAPAARLDGRGCLVDSDGMTLAEVTASGDLWTPHGVFHFQDGALQLAAGRTLRIAADGAVQPFAASGGRELSVYGAMRFEGFNESVRCAAQVLLGVYASAMPSMAVGEAHAADAAVPEGSACPHRPRRRGRHTR